MIIGISGKINHGKDRVGDCIQYLTSFASTLRVPLEWYRKSRILKFIFPSKFENKKFAAKLKFISAYLTGHPLEDMYSHEGKEMWLPEWEMTVRDFQIKLGTPGMRDGVHKDGWIISLFADYWPEQLREFSSLVGKKVSNWVITDMRFKNEYLHIKDKKGFTVRVNRPEITNNLNHVSETDLDDVTDWDFVITNDGTLKDLLDKVRLMLYYIMRKEILNGLKVTPDTQMVY